MLNKIDTTLGAGLIMIAMTLGCVSAEDEANMTKKMALETERSKIIDDNIADCAKLKEELTKFQETKGKEIVALDDWWVPLGDMAKDKLISKHQDEWDNQTASMAMGALSCNQEFSEALKAGK